jgi:hypothetical protein
MFNPTLPVVLALLAVSLFCYRTFCLRRLNSPAAGPEPGGIQAPISKADAADGALVGARSLSESQLRPAELAYLIREGDRSHATIVLAFDLLHRAVKSLQSDSAAVSLAPYEMRLFVKVKEFAKRWLEEKTTHLVPDPRSGDVRLLVRQVSGLYSFLVKSVRPFVSEIIEDPRRIRRYFTIAGIMRLLADVGSAGYREALETEMVSDMKARGVLASEPARKRSAAYLAVGFVGGAVLAFVIVLLLVSNSNLAIAAFLTSSLVALGLRLVWGLGEFLPLYSELRDVASHIRRKGWRLTVLRLGLKFVGGVLYSLVAVVGLALFAMQILCLHLIFPEPLPETISLSLMLCGIWLLLLELAFDAHKIRLRSQPSLSALALIADSRLRLSGVSPVDTFRQLLTSPEYSPECSELLAIYGIETLFLLA